MTPRMLTTSVELTGTESAQFAVLAARFKLTDDQLVGELLRHGLSLAGNENPGTAASLREFLDQQINVQEAVSDSIRGAMDRIEEGLRAQTIVAGLMASRLAELPHAKPPS